MAKQVPKDETTVYKLLTLLRKNTNGVTYRELRDWAISRKTSPRARQQALRLRMPNDRHPSPLRLVPAPPVVARVR